MNLPAPRNRARLWLTRRMLPFCALLVICAREWPVHAHDGWLAATLPAVCDDKQASEHQLKAAFLYHFARYVRWPKEAFSDTKAPLIVAVLGRDPFGRVLDETFDQRKVGDRAIKVVRFADMESLGDCHILFTASAEEVLLPKLRERLKGRPVLLVTESIATAEQGAQVGFYLDGARVRFAINTAALKSAGLEASSELLKLARILDGEKRSSS